MTIRVDPERNEIHALFALADFGACTFWRSEWRRAADAAVRGQGRTRYRRRSITLTL